MTATGTRLGIFMVLHCQHAIGDRQTKIQRDAGKALRATVCNVLVVARVTTHHATQGDDRNMLPCMGHGTGGKWNFPRARHAHHIYAFHRNAIATQGHSRTFHQRVGDTRIPATGDDRKSRTRRHPQIAFQMRH